MSRIPELLVKLLCGVFLAVLVTPWVVASAPPFEKQARADTNGVSATSISRSKILAVSKQIDALVLKQLNEKEEQLNQSASDEVFLRRIYLDLAGRIPTIEETNQFLASPNKNKRSLLIDRLLDSYGWVSRQFNFYADLLRVKSRAGNVMGQPYIDFIKDSLSDNKPYDQFVRELLTSEGPMLREGNGAVGYYLRDVAMPEDNMSNTIRVFLGTRLECAQCHDHPFDKWTQRQYFEMVAFTGGMGYRLQHPDSEYSEEIFGLRKMRDEIDPQVLRVLRRIVQPMTYGISGTGTGLARLPEGFMGDDGEEFDIVTGKTMFGELPLVEAEHPSSRKSKRVGKNPQVIFGAREVNSREKYAEWLVSADNPRFARVIANRLWKQAFGLGLIEPVDVIEDSTVASNPELMDYLTQTMIDLEFDTKQYLRAIYNSSTYQRMSTGTDVVDPSKYNFNGPIVRRMSAEQLWDSLLTLTVEDVDQRQSAQSRMRYLTPGTGDIYDEYERLRQMSVEELIATAEELSQGDRRARKSMMAKAERQKYQAEVTALKKRMAVKMKKARKAGDSSKLRQLRLEMSELAAKYQKNRKRNTFLRASEIASPARPGHFLREFGQSDRESIDNSNSDPAVTQVLSLMNGVIEKQIANNSSTVLRNVFKSKEGKKLDAVFLTMLSRYPTRGEQKIWRKDFKTNDNKNEVVADLIWVLANSNEFIFVK